MNVQRNEKQISIVSEYNPDLPSKAKKLGGKWSPSTKSWIFDIRDESRVADLYRSIYGEWDNDDDIPADAVTARVTITTDISEYHSGIFFAGRQVARATGRDSGAKLGAGIIVLGGNFDSGGSVKNWRTCAKEGTIFEIRDVPLCKVEEEMEKEEWKIEILGNVDKAALMAEKERLLARIQEIDLLIKN